MTDARSRVALAAVVFVVLLAQVLLYPGIDTLVGAYGVEGALRASTWFLAVEIAAFVVFAGVWGAASDATGRRAPLIALGALGGAVGYAALAAVPSLGGLPFAGVLLVRALQGAATIGALSLSMTMLMDLGGGHGRNMGLAGVAIGGGTALGAPLGGQLYARGPLVPLVAASALLVVAAALALTLTDRAPERNPNPLGAIVAGLRATPGLSLPYAFGFLDRLTAGFFALVGTFYLRTAFGLDPAATGLTLALFFAPFALLQYPMGRLSDRIGRAGPVVVGSALYGLGVVAVGAAPSLDLARAAMVAVGVLGALMAPATMALVADLAPATERGVAMAGFNVAGSVGFLAGIVLGGAVAGAYGFWPSFLAVGGLEVALAVLAVPAFLRWDLGRRGAGADER